MWAGVFRGLVAMVLLCRGCWADQATASEWRRHYGCEIGLDESRLRYSHEQPNTDYTWIAGPELAVVMALRRGASWSVDSSLRFVSNGAMLNSESNGRRIQIAVETKYTALREMVWRRFGRGGTTPQIGVGFELKYLLRSQVELKGQGVGHTSAVSGFSDLDYGPILACGLERTFGKVIGGIEVGYARGLANVNDSLNRDTLRIRNHNLYVLARVLG